MEPTPQGAPLSNDNYSADEWNRLAMDKMREELRDLRNPWRRGSMFAGIGAVGIALVSTVIGLPLAETKWQKADLLASKAKDDTTAALKQAADAKKQVADARSETENTENKRSEAKAEIAEVEKKLREIQAEVGRILREPSYTAEEKNAARDVAIIAQRGLSRVTEIAVYATQADQIGRAKTRLQEDLSKFAKVDGVSFELAQKPHGAGTVVKYFSKELQSGAEIIADQIRHKLPSASVVAELDEKDEEYSVPGRNPRFEIYLTAGAL